MKEKITNIFLYVYYGFSLIMVAGAMGCLLFGFLMLFNFSIWAFLVLIILALVSYLVGKSLLI